MHGSTAKSRVLHLQAAARDSLPRVEGPRSPSRGIRRGDHFSYHLPIEADESAFSLQMVYRLLQAGAVDLINTKCGKAMGIKGVREWATVAKGADADIVIGTEWGAGLKVAAKFHLGAALANANPVVEFTEIMIHELLLKKPLKLEDGYLRVPTAPGLGMELDDGTIEEFRTPEA